MALIRLAAAPLNQTPIDWEGNLRRAVVAIDAARDAGARLVVLPELCLSAYGCEDLHFADDLQRRALDTLSELLPHTRGVAATVGLPLKIAGKLFNAIAMIVDGRVVGFPLKQHLANDGLHYEQRWFHPWPVGERVEIDFAGGKVPAGDLVFDFDGVGVGVENCRDAWVGEARPAHRWAKLGISLLLNSSASHFAFGKQKVRERLTREGAAIVGGASLFVNLLGNESGRTIFDGGVLLAQATGENRAEIVGDARRFAMSDHTLSVFDVEVEARVEDAPSVLKTGFGLAPTKLGQGYAPEVRDTHRKKLEEFSRIVPLGLLDYLRKSGAGGFVLSLSGGADSAACAVLVGLMARLGINELGLEGFAARLPRVPGLAEASDWRDATRRLLTTVYQATRNSSDTTRDAAAAVAGAVGAEHHAWEVDHLVDGYRELAEKALCRSLAWETDDLALQNIQSRVRSPGVWMLANLKNALLLTTGNRSEASVGYATMDGDTSGGLAPLSGVDKAFLREWLRWMETDGPEGIGPTPELAAINAQQPTAELRPQSESQTDEADLMPYEVLDAIERSAIARLETPAETLAGLREAYPDAAEEQLAAWVGRFWSLWRASQWKRERMAPGFHVDTHSVDSRAWRRWPILSGQRAVGGRQ